MGQIGHAHGLVPPPPPPSKFLVFMELGEIWAQIRLGVGLRGNILLTKELGVDMSG